MKSLVYWRAEEFLELDDFDPVRHVRPIVVPTHDAVALLRVVTVRLETTGPELEFDPHTFLGFACVPIRQTVWKGRSDLLDSKLQPLSDVSEEEYDA